MMVNMDDVTAFDRFDRAAAVAVTVVASIRPDQYGDPTPCPRWPVRRLLNHVILGAKVYVAMLTGAGAVDMTADHVGLDHGESFRAAVANLRAAFATPGALERVHASPLGEATGLFLIRTRVNELMVHAWDLARATGQSTDLDPDLAAECEADVRRAQEAGLLPHMFAAAQACPADATAADRMAAAAGRTVW
jgi:uncharacterized protein (TIGR03086 family)